jgi:hypothetical protein
MRLLGGRYWGGHFNDSKDTLAINLTVVYVLATAFSYALKSENLKVLS